MWESAGYTSTWEIFPPTITLVLLDVYFNFEDYDGPLIDLSTMSELACLTFSVQEHEPSMYSYIPLPAINKLCELHHWFVFDVHSYRWDEVWTTLDDVLAEPKFKGLESIHFKTQLESWGAWMLDKIQELRELLPNISGRKYLCIETALGLGNYLNKKNFPVIPE